MLQARLVKARVVGGVAWQESRGCRGNGKVHSIDNQ
uniref:Uncharacterized protein n=1 Tax=Ralstonia solanacearum TaxID=305 RepID=A0A0S4UYD6_RALSL|nr:protein of unknown function [Ralstonia solanacearum]